MTWRLKVHMSSMQSDNMSETTNHPETVLATKKEYDWRVQQTGTIERLEDGFIWSTRMMWTGKYILLWTSVPLWTKQLLPQLTT